MHYTPEISSASIVLVGKFNPAIFTPAWFAKVGIITDSELGSSATRVVHPEITQFDISRFRVEVQPARFQITTMEEPFVSILDDIEEIFVRHLPHTPTGSFGINYNVHFLLSSPGQRIALGRALAPTEPWGAFGSRLAEPTSPELASGMVTLIMQETNPSDRNKGARRVKVQPSKKVDKLRGVFVDINDHFEMETSDEIGAGDSILLLRERFDASIAESKTIVSELMTFASRLT